MESMWSQFQNLNGIILSKSTELLGWYRIHCGNQCQTSWASRNPIFEYQLSWNLINAYQELNFFIFKCGVFHIISDFYLPLMSRHPHHLTNCPFEEKKGPFPLLGGHFVDIFCCKKVLFWQEKASVMWWFRAFVATWALSHLRAFLVWFWCRLLCRHWGFCADIVQISAQKNAHWNLWVLGRC